MAQRMRKKQAVGYCRVSTTGQQRNGTGLDRQEQVITEYAEHAGYELIQVYQEAITGTDADRPVFAQMLADMLSNSCRVVIVERLDRPHAKGAVATAAAAERAAQPTAAVGRPQQDQQDQETRDDAEHDDAERVHHEPPALIGTAARMIAVNDAASRRAPPTPAPAVWGGAPSTPAFAGVALAP